MKKRSKRYNESVKLKEEDKVYTLAEAIKTIKGMKPVKFDGSLEMHFHLNIDTKKSDQLVRGTVVLPHGTGKKVRIAVFCKGEFDKMARDAKADHVGANELIDKVNGGFMDFDCVIATPDMMKDLSRLGKVLGPRGLMPSPKTGTVTNDIVKAIEDVRKGKVEFRADKQGDVHLAVGKVSFDEEKLTENANCILNALNEAKPASVKGKFIESFFVSSTMNPALRVNIN